MTVKVQVQDETPRLKTEVGKAMITSLSHAAAFIRKAAVNSIRRSKKPSAPGDPPRTRAGVLKRGIMYALDSGRESAVIGPTKSALGVIGETHEFGGTEPPKDRQSRVHRFELVTGGFGPIRNLTAESGRGQSRRSWQKGDKLLVVVLHSQRQVERARQVASTIPPSAGGPASKKQRVYPARPFMGPALNRSLSRLPSFWANSVKGG